MLLFDLKQKSFRETSAKPILYHSQAERMIQPNITTDINDLEQTSFRETSAKPIIYCS